MRHLLMKMTIMRNDLESNSSASMQYEIEHVEHKMCFQMRINLISNFNKLFQFFDHHNPNIKRIMSIYVCTGLISVVLWCKDSSEICHSSLTILRLFNCNILAIHVEKFRLHWYKYRNISIFNDNWSDHSTNGYLTTTLNHTPILFVE